MCGTAALGLLPRSLRLDLLRLGLGSSSPPPGSLEAVFFLFDLFVFDLGVLLLDLLQAPPLWLTRGVMATWWAVYHGRVPGVCTTWAQVCGQVVGVQNPLYKGFKSREQAEVFFLEYMASQMSPNRPGCPTWYVVYHGRQPGIYETWAACCAQVVGFINPMYKAFPTKEEAVASYLEFTGCEDTESEGSC